jgi:IS5 family transposase
VTKQTNTHERVSPTMYIRQLGMFSFEETLKFDPNDRLLLVLDSVDFEPVITILDKKRGNGRNDYPNRTMLQCLIGGIVNRSPSIRQLIEELRKNPGFRYLCGIDNAARIPTESAFSRFLSNLIESDALLAMEKVFQQLVTELSKLLPDYGQTGALDATHLEAFARGSRKHPSDPDAKWGRKKDNNGNWFRWFGYKLHLLVDAKHELPMAFTVTPANENDGEQLIPIMQAFSQEQPQIEMQTLLADSIYDPEKNYQFCFDKGIALLTPLNHRKRKEPEVGFTKDQQPLGTCGHPLTFAGYDNGFLKYRCPAKTGHLTCPFGDFGETSSFCSDSPYGLTLKYSVQQNPRKFCRVPRHTKKFKRLYSMRTSVERVNSRLKGPLIVDKITHRGLAKVRVHILFSLLTMMGSAIGLLNKGRIADIRKITKLVA